MFAIEVHPSSPSNLPPAPRILLVDDDVLFRETLSKLLQLKGFVVVEAVNVVSALKLIATEPFDAVLSDLHMPAAGDGLTVVSAMRHFQPNAVTILLSAFPDLSEASKAILRHADEVLLKPTKIDTLIATVTKRLERGARTPHVFESLSAILKSETQATIQEWLGCVDTDPLVTMIPLDDNVRCAHLPQLFADLVARLQNPLPLGRRALASPSAAAHGLRRCHQGYSAAMLVEESRLLQVSIFQTLHNNLHRIEFGSLLSDVMTIADEVDSQLAQQMVSYTSGSTPAALLSA